MGSSPTPTCPRCGYDLSGHVATFTSACPLESTCSECAYTFAWRDVLSEAFKPVAGYYEHARSMWSVGSLVKTCARALVPWRFFRRVRMHHRVRVGRLVLYVVLLLAPVMFLQGLARYTDEYFASGGAAMVGPPRTGQFINWNVAWQQVSGPRPDTFGIGFVHYWGLRLNNPGGRSALWVDASNDAPDSCFRPLSGIVLAYSVAFGAILAMLPASLARARVRRVHLLRAAALSCSILAIPAMASLVVFMARGVVSIGMYYSGLGVVGERLDFPADPTPLSMIPTWALVCLLWSCVWWFVVVRLYLRLERAALIWLLLTIASLLAAAIAFVRATPIWQFRNLGIL